MLIGLTLSHAWSIVVSMVSDFTWLQSWILLTSVVSISMVTSPDAKIRRIGCVIGLAGSPAWLYTTSSGQQPGAFIASIVFACSYMRGLFPSHFSKLKKAIFK